MRGRPIPCALSIAGSDSGGGAGIQADLKAFSALGVHGTTAITCVTAQNPQGVRGIQACTPLIVEQQIQAVLEAFKPTAAKTGMLFSTPIIRAVVKALSTSPRLPLVVDPVMVATSGARLLKPAAVNALCRELLPLATVVTPNLQEAEMLCGTRLHSPEDLRYAARELHRRFHCAALVKGGHLHGMKEAIDIFYDGKQELLLASPFIRGVSTHGTGCTYSAAIAGCLALGMSLPKAVQEAKLLITRAIAHGRFTSGQSLLNP
jgi:hydroxymethylpyrimidine/phosphomethylpyrimidine kinase